MFGLVMPNSNVNSKRWNSITQWHTFVITVNGCWGGDGGGVFPLCGGIDLLGLILAVIASHHRHLQH